MLDELPVVGEPDRGRRSGSTMAAGRWWHATKNKQRGKQQKRSRISTSMMLEIRSEPKISRR
jgi:hypothetical protein